MEWICRKTAPDGRECGQVVLSDKKPDATRWTDGHVCYFTPLEITPETTADDERESDDGQEYPYTLGEYETDRERNT